MHVPISASVISGNRQVSLHITLTTILTTKRLSAASVNNQPELEPNTFSLLLFDKKNTNNRFIIQKSNATQHNSASSEHSIKYNVDVAARRIIISNMPYLSCFTNYNTL